MSLLSGFVLMALATQTPAPPLGQTVVVLHYRRPSSVVAQAAGMQGELVADDARSTVTLSGTPAQVKDAKEFIRLFDVPRQPVRLRVTVNSPADHLSWTVDAHLSSGQRWKTSDDESGSEIALEPRLDSAGELNVMVIVRSRGIELRSAMRLPKGQEKTVELGRSLIQRYSVDVEKGNVHLDESAIPLPAVTLRYLGG